MYTVDAHSKLYSTLYIYLYQRIYAYIRIHCKARRTRYKVNYDNSNNGEYVVKREIGMRDEVAKCIEHGMTVLSVGRLMTGRSIGERVRMHKKRKRLREGEKNREREREREMYVEEKGTKVEGWKRARKF